MAASDDNFFSRWSRRKQAVRSGQAPLPEPGPRVAAVPAQPPEPIAAPANPAPAAVDASATTSATTSAEPAPPPPTLDDVAQLTPEADFRRFVAPEVPNEVRNAAVKKLFADPHFNVMDGLDVYIDDYSQPSPLSKAELAMMVGAQFLKLVDDPNPQPAEAAPGADGATPTETSRAAEPDPGADPGAASDGPTAADTTAPHDEHADLQLQPDHEPGSESPGRGAG